MSREVMDAGPPDTAPAEDLTAHDPPDDEQSTDLDDETPAPPSSPDEPRGTPSESPSGSPSGVHWSSASRLRLVAPVALVAIAALALGGYAGAAQTRQNDHAALLSGTRLVVWVSAATPAAASVSTGEIAATAISTGARVLVHQLRTSFGTAVFAPEVRLDSGVARALPVRLTPDCSMFDANADPGGLPRTGTAAVRDRPGAPLRDVPVELTGDFVTAAFVTPCSQLGDQALLSSSALTTSVTIDGVVGPPVPVVRLAVGFADMRSRPGGTLSFVAGLSGDPRQQVRLDIATRDSDLASADGNFTVTAQPPLPITLQGQADPVFVTLHIAYRCPRGLPNVPFPDSILRPRIETDTAIATGVTSGGWDTVAAGEAVRAAAATAGCPLS